MVSLALRETLDSPPCDPEPLFGFQTPHVAGARHPLGSALRRTEITHEWRKLWSCTHISQAHSTLVPPLLFFLKPNSMRYLDFPRSSLISLFCPRSPPWGAHYMQSYWALKFLWAVTVCQGFLGFDDHDSP